MATDQKGPLSYLHISKPLTIVIIRELVLHGNDSLLNFGRDTKTGHFWSVAKVALRFGYAKQSKNLEMYLLHMYYFIIVLIQELLQGNRYNNLYIDT